MGIDAVNSALAHVHGLALGETKVLLRMAAGVLDKPNDKGQKPGLYYAGEEPLLGVLYGPQAEGYTASQVRHVRRTLASLRKKGLIEPLGLARAGTRQTWLQRYFFMGPQGGAGSHPQGDLSNHPEGGAGGPLRVVQEVTPRTHKDQIEDSELGHTSTSQPQFQTARDDERDEGDGVGERWVDERCRHGHLVRLDTCGPCADERPFLTPPRPALRLIDGETA